MLVNANVGCIHPQTSCFTVSYKESVGVNAIFELFFKKNNSTFPAFAHPQNHDGGQRCDTKSGSVFVEAGGALRPLFHAKKRGTRAKKRERGQ